MSRRSSGSSSSFGSRKTSKSRGERIRDRYSTDRYATAEDFIKAVERNPEHFDPGSMDQGKFRYDDSGNGRGVGASNLKGSNKSNWIDDNPIDVDVSTDPGSASVSVEAWNNDQGDSVEIVAGVDLIPMGIDINVNGDVGTIAVDLGMPGDAIGVTAGVSFDTDTGEVIGGQVGLAGGGLAVDVNQIRKDGETCTTVTVTYMGIGASYQRCRKDDDDDEKEPPKEPPPPNDDEIPPAPPIELIPGNPTDTVFCIVSANQYTKTESTTKDKTYTISSSSQYSGSSSVGPGYAIVSENFKARTRDNAGFNESNTAEALTYLPWRGQPYPELEVTPQYILDDPGFKLYGWYSVQGSYMGSGGIHMGRVADVNAMLTNYYANIMESAEGFTRVFWRLKKIDFYHIIETGKEGPEKPKKPKEPDPPIPPGDDMSNCCDLEPVMSLLRKVSTAIGTDQLPANMPKSFLKNEGARKIPSLAELQVYQIEVIDQLIGKFPIELEILDTDPLSPGDQTKKVVLQNLAESIAELFGLAINSSHDNAIQTSGVIKNLLEITLVRQAVLQNYYRLDAILDYLGAGLEEDEATFNSTISLPKDPNNISEDVADFLQQSEIKFVIDKLADPKDTLTAKLLPIQKAADIIKAKYWKGFGKAGGDYTGAIKEWLKTYDPKNEQNETDWKDKLDKILEEYAKDATGNIDKDRMPVIQNITQIGSEPVPPPEAK